MPRKKPELNVWERYVANMPSYHREAGRILLGEHDVLTSFVVPGVDANGSLMAKGYELEPVTDPCLVRWLDALLDLDKHGDRSTLIALLDSDFDLPSIVRIWIAVSLKRYDIKKRRDVPRAMPYEKSVLELLIESDTSRDAWLDLVDGYLGDHHRHRLARMIERYNFIGLPHRRRAVAYDMTDAEVRLYLANEKVSEYYNEGLTIRNAVARVATETFPLPQDEEERTKFEETLCLYRDGRHTSARTAKRRRS